MDGGQLVFTDKHDLFAIGLIAFLRMAVAKRDQGQPFFQEIAASEIGQVPSQGIFLYLIALFAFGFPYFRLPTYPFGQIKRLAIHKIQGFPDVTVYLTSFHGICFLVNQ